MAASKNSAREAREAREARDRLRRYNARQEVHTRQVRRRRRDNIGAVSGVVLVAALATVTQLLYFNGGPGTPVPSASASAAEATPSATASPTPGQNVGNVPAPTFAEGRTWTGSMTLNGNVELGVSLDGAAAPQAVSSILADSTTGYYVGKTCHRLVIGDTAGLIQCGSLDGTGATDPGYSFGPIENAPADGIYKAGTIAMARAGGDAYSNGRQFFIVFQDTSLPADAAGGYSVVGSVSSGLDSLVAQIAAAGTSNGQSDGPPVVPTTISAFAIQ